MNSKGFGVEGPGDIDIIMDTKIQNVHPGKSLTIISGEFEGLNNLVLKPQEQILVSILVPAGFREYMKSTSFKEKEYIYIGLRDKDAADPLIHKPAI